ncbi:MAG: TM2 domain-containing protein [Gammaproteobacteria bacterium]
MIGHIENFDPDQQTGTIKSGDDTYEFHIDDWTADVPPDAGDDVRFELEDGKSRQITLVGAYLDQPKAVKFKYLAATLSLLFGWAGLSRFYLGYYRMGFIQLLLSAILLRSGFIVFVPQWGFVEALLLVAGKFDRDAKGRPLR